MDIVTLAMAKKYTRDSLIGMGALQGAPCKIKSIVKDADNSKNIVTFEWTDNNGDSHISTMEVPYGTPIYVWERESGRHYAVGDLVIYNASFYQCVIANSDSQWNESHWNGLGSPDGKYFICNSESDLPQTFRPEDQRMYYVLEEFSFYYWNGTEWNKQEEPISDSDIDELFL